MPLKFFIRAVWRPALTSNFSFSYLCLFLPAAVAAYALCPRKWKQWILLLASYAFFFIICGGRVYCLIGSTVSVYALGLLVDYIGERGKAAAKAAEKAERKAIKQRYAARQHWVTFLGIALNIGLLLYFKYTGFLLENANALSEYFGLGISWKIPRIIVPIGVSFYTLQALSYLLDISRGALRADRNLGRVALFVSFFPQIVEGPICRYEQTAKQLWEAKPITYQNLKLGGQRILYGMMKKLVVADRLNSFVALIFDSYGEYGGGYVWLAAMAYTAQLYMDFSGAMDCVCGTAQIFGIQMPENFRAPFFSKTISEFWTRWHISLGTWFRDYIFYPVTMAKPMKRLTSSARKKLGNHFGPLLAGSVALLCVWFSNGLWHGSAWSYIFFGMYHFFLILMGNAFAPLSARTRQKLHLEGDSAGFAMFQRLRTAVLVVIGELFFRADGLQNGFAMFGRMLTDFTFSGDAAQLGIDWADVGIVVVTLAIVCAVSVLKERNIQIRQTLDQKPLALRWAVWYGLIVYILLFGAYGGSYLPVDPMYANF